jgi:glycosyltransferase involved in cell wall biosynthesis
VRVLVVASAEGAGTRWADAAYPVHLPVDLVTVLGTTGHDVRLELLPDPEHDGQSQPHAYARAAAAGAWLAARQDCVDGAVLHALDPAAAMACLAARAATGVPVVVRWGAMCEPATATERRLRLAALRAADVVLASTEALGRQARAGGAPQVAVVSDGIDCELIGGACDLRPEGGTPRIVTLSGPDAAGGTAALVGALQHLPDVELVVAGRARDDGDAGRLLEAADAAGVGDRVRWLGWLPRDKALDIVSDADVVVSPRGSATSAASALEAMCRARPVVAADQPVIADIVQHGTTGFVVPTGDSLAFANAIRSLLADPFRREAFAQAGADRVAAVHDWSRIAVRLEAAYQRAVAGGVPRLPGLSTGASAPPDREATA